jgi:hypothetical protein
VKLSPTGVLTGISVGKQRQQSWQEAHDARMQSFALMVESGIAYPALSGRIGDCCDDEEAEVG